MLLESLDVGAGGTLVNGVLRISEYLSVVRRQRDMAVQDKKTLNFVWGLAWMGMTRIDGENLE